MKFKSFLLTFLLGAVMVGSSQAATFTVTKTADTNDGTCDADCSLREAITVVNAGAGGDTVVFALPGSGPHSITLSGQISITKNVSILNDSAGDEPVKLTFNGVQDRHFTSYSSTQCTLAGLTLENGSPNPNISFGGGAINHFGSILTVRNCRFVNNKGTGGGAINSGADSYLSVSNCTFENNRAVLESNNDGPGGAIYGEFGHLSNCSFKNNTASSGGAVFSLGLGFYSCIFEGNTAQSGGAIFVSSGRSAGVFLSSFLNNTAVMHGGAIYGNYSSNHLISCTFSGNEAGGYGNAVYTKNVYGGTMATNTSVRDCTFFRNDPPDNRIGYVFYTETSTTRIKNSIFDEGPDSYTFYNVNGAILSEGFNLSRENAHVFGQSTDKKGIDPRLAPGGPQYNGGFAPTIALMPDSPALDAGDSLESTDQRSLTRTYDNPSINNATGGNGSDIGAYERQGTLPQLFINDVAVSEGPVQGASAGTTDAIFTITLDAPVSETVTVNAITANGTAKAPGDYTSGSATLTFAPGETRKTFSVPVVGDYIVEPDETFTVNLSNAVNAAIAGAPFGSGQGIGTITNDDNDVTAPTVRFTTSATTPVGTTPVNGSTIYNAMPAITGTATDAGSGISKVLLRLYRVKAGTTNVYEYWNGSAWISTVFYFTTTLTPATGGANVTWSKNSGWPTGTDFSDGTYYMVATAYDKANKTAAVSSSFKKLTDNELPTVRFTTSATTPVGTTPVKGGTITGAIPTITGEATDAGSGISKVLLRLYRIKAGTTNTYEYWNGTSWISTVFYFTTTLNPATGGANVSWSKNSGWPTGTDFSDGTYYMVATAYDKVNKTAAVSSSFKKATVAGLAPRAVTLSTAQALADSQSIKLSFTGALSNASASQTTNYIVRVNGTPVEVQKATYDGASSAVTLQLAVGTLEAGDTVTVSWNLRDSSGKMVNGQTELTVE